MIGCIAKARCDTLHMDDAEMEEVRWVSRADVAKALDRSSSKDNPLTGAISVIISPLHPVSAAAAGCHKSALLSLGSEGEVRM